MSTKRRAVSRDCTISQTPVAWMRTCAFVNSGVCQPRYTPAVTAAITADPPRSSARMDPRAPGRSDIAIRARAAGGRDGRHAEELGRDERDVAREERDRDLRGRVVEAPPDLPNEPRDGQADADPASDAPDEEPAGVEGGERPGDDRGDGNAVGHKPRPVIHEALPFHDRH